MKRILTHLTAAAALTGLIAACSAQADQPVVANQDAGKGQPRAERMFERFDANQDGQITRDEAKARVAERFERMDANKDGTVTRDERRAARQDRRGDRKARMFARMDANGDGAVTLDEMKARTSKRAERRFTRLDTNADGSLSLAEVQTAKGRRGGGKGGHRGGHHRGQKGPMTMQDLDARVMRMFDRADQNKDGVITLDEAKLMRGHGRRG